MYVLKYPALQKKKKKKKKKNGVNLITIGLEIRNIPVLYFIFYITEGMGAAILNIWLNIYLFQDTNISCLLTGILCLCEFVNSLDANEHSYSYTTTKYCFRCDLFNFCTFN